MTVASLLNSGADIQTEDRVSWLHGSVYRMSVIVIPFYMDVLYP